MATFATAELEGSGSGSSSHTKKKKRQQQQQVFKDCPQEFLCELCRRPMSDPVRSIFGHYYERSVIDNWIQKQGHICPMTGKIFYRLQAVIFF